MLKKADYVVRSVPQEACVRFVREHHYAKGCSHTATYRFGLFSKREDTLLGVTMWLPPTKPAAISVDPRWRAVLNLSRMAVAPGVPRNACSFMLSRAIKAIMSHGRYHSFVTYADNRVGHDGLVYLASNWIPVGQTQATTTWLDHEGRQVAQQSTRTRTRAEMEFMGYKDGGKHTKRKFVLYPGRDFQSKLLRLEANIARLTEALRLC